MSHSISSFEVTQTWTAHRHGHYASLSAGLVWRRGKVFDIMVTRTPSRYDYFNLFGLSTFNFFLGCKRCESLIQRECITPVDVSEIVNYQKLCFSVRQVLRFRNPKTPNCRFLPFRAPKGSRQKAEARLEKSTDLGNFFGSFVEDALQKPKQKPLNPLAI